MHAILVLNHLRNHLNLFSFGIHINHGGIMPIILLYAKSFTNKTYNVIACKMNTRINSYKLPIFKVGDLE